ncbi:MAG TPA: VWA domain-containing protein [Thermomicrobiales bacterium]|nr:VWA domain-containing protein [Thermomicrobiales bacterium]
MMTFLAPVGFVAGLSLIGIILLHMRRQVPATRSVPSLRFWTPAKRDDLERTKLRKPPLSWLLLLQLLAALALTIALARPVSSGILGEFGGHTDPRHQIAILDGSTSMQALIALGTDQTRFTAARGKVVDLLDSWQPGDITTVLVAGSQIQTYTATDQQQANTLRHFFGKLAPPGGRADMNAALRLAGDLVLPDRANQITMITDGAVTVDPAIAAGISAPISLDDVGTGSETTNDAITDISARTDPTQRDHLRLAFTVSHFSDASATVPYTVQSDGNDLANSTVTLGPDESRQIELSIPADASAVNVSIPQQDILLADNSASLQLQRDALSQLNVMLVTDNPGDVQRALDAIPGTHVDTFPGSTPGLKAVSAGYDLAVFEGITPAADDLPSIPMVLFQPPPLGDTFAIDGSMSAPTIDKVDAGASILNGVDLAGVTFSDVPTYTLPAGATEIVGGLAADGTSGPLIWQGTLGGESYVATSFTTQSSNIGDRVAFPILMARTVQSLTKAQIPGALALGDPLVYSPSGDVVSLKIDTPSRGSETIAIPTSGASALDRTITFTDTSDSGVYTIHELAADGSTLRQGSFVVNAGQRQESNLQPNPSLASSISQASASSGTTGSGAADHSDLWPLLVAGALAAIVLEWLLVARRGGRRPSFEAPAATTTPGAEGGRS